ncbi:hypothetical protein DSO57_1013372 [Entomophthora muscae]|uniref:Uncharacterized protein n=1 Tax=Entomophthora muscae TaxID=34485 RepID=A0ACC2RKL2_9FUNG|nr:hypothetical protein DSO57_1013372 [Entomophthora muscae]
MPLLNRNRVSCTSEAFEIAKRKNETHTPSENVTRPVALSIFGLVIFAQLLAFGLVLLITHTTNDTPPTPLANNSSAVLAMTPDFSVHAAYAHLEVITRHPHFFNMRANDDVRNYILDYANRVRTQINPSIQVLDDNTPVAFTGKDTPTGMFGNSNVTGYLESGNVLVRIQGSANTGNALLISAHFDSVQLSYGANDNGIGVVAAMEMVRLFALHPPKHDLIFNFNNFEEAGVLGSVAFMAHEWASTVRAFLNLEGAGAGGRVLLFQCSNPRLAELARAIPRPTTSVLGNDLFQMRVINSVTDYAVYSGKKGIPGVDFAIFRNRAVYHTLLDNIQHAYMSTLESMGQSLWPLAQAIDESSFLESKPQIESAGVFYSLLSLATFQYSFVTDHILGAAAMILILLTVTIYLACPKLQRGFYPDRWTFAAWPPHQGPADHYAWPGAISPCLVWCQPSHHQSQRLGNPSPLGPGLHVEHATGCPLPCRC